MPQPNPVQTKDDESVANTHHQCLELVLKYSTLVLLAVLGTFFENAVMIILAFGIAIALVVSAFQGSSVIATLPGIGDLTVKGVRRRVPPGTSSTSPGDESRHE